MYTDDSVEMFQNLLNVLNFPPSQLFVRNRIFLLLLANIKQG